MVNNCKDCMKRGITCHVTCEIYAEFLKENEKRKKQQQKQSVLNSVSFDSVGRACSRRWR